MKHIFLFLLTIMSASAIAQSGSAKQVNWTTSAKKIAENLYEVKLIAEIKGNYHLYAQDAGVEGPIPTLFTFSPNPLVTMNGKVKEMGKMVKKYEEAWPGNVNYYEKKVEFVQQIKLKTKVKTNLSGKVEFIVCNDVECLPPSEVDFKVAVGG